MVKIRQILRYYINKDKKELNVEIRWDKLVLDLDGAIWAANRVLVGH